MAGAWQGRGNAALSPAGRIQVEALARRLARHRFDLVVSSPLERATETAAALADDIQTRHDLIEIDLGGWEGVSFEAVSDRAGDVLRSIYRGGDDRFGDTGERMSEVAARTWAVIDDLARLLGPDGRAAVVTHGGVIDSLISTLLPTVSRRPHRMVSNTALTHIVGDPGSWRLARFNDTAHLGTLPPFAASHVATGGAVLALVRHGRTRANVEGRFQGQSCWGIDEMGEKQAVLLADWYGRIETVYSSPLTRALATARVISVEPPHELDGLMEIGLGAWEGLTGTDVRDGWPELARRIYEDGEDLARGESGETWADATGRIVEAVTSIPAAGGQVTGVVTHGGVLRAFVGTLGGDETSTMSRLANPANTSVTHVALTDDGPILCDYAVAAHLEQAALAK